MHTEKKNSEMIYAPQVYKAQNKTDTNNIYIRQHNEHFSHYEMYFVSLYLKYNQAVKICLVYFEKENV